MKTLEPMDLGFRLLSKRNISVGISLLGHNRNTQIMSSRSHIAGHSQRTGTDEVSEPNCIFLLGLGKMDRN